MRVTIQDVHPDRPDAVFFAAYLHAVLPEDEVFPVLRLDHGQSPVEWSPVSGSKMDTLYKVMPGTMEWSDMQTTRRKPYDGRNKLIRGMHVAL